MLKNISLIFKFGVEVIFPSRRRENCFSCMLLFSRDYILVQIIYKLNFTQKVVREYFIYFYIWLPFLFCFIYLFLHNASSPKWKSDCSAPGRNTLSTAVHQITLVWLVQAFWTSSYKFKWLDYSNMVHL